MDENRFINMYNGGANIDLREILKQMITVDNFRLHSGKEALLKFDIDKLDKEICEDIFIYGMSNNVYIPGVIMSGASRFIKKGTKHIQIYPDIPDFNLYLPFGYNISLENRNVYLIDDVVTTGNAMDSAQKILENNGFVVSGKICLLNRGNYKCKSLINREQMMEWLGL